MNKISCHICWDLIPLVQDNVSSEDSRIAVMEHIKECESCLCIFNEVSFEQPKMDNKRVVSKIKKQLYFTSLIIIVLGAMVGIGLSEGMGMFYNVLIMPVIGAIGYFALGKKSYYVAATLFIFAYLWHLIKYIFEGMFSHTTIISAIIAPASWALIYSGLCCLGIIIGCLLQIAFRKEGEDEEVS